MLVEQLILLIEARRNPQQNPKEDTTEYLRDKYGNSPSNIFVSFSNTNKFGIHPSSPYNTPNGFYCYPLQYILDLPRGTHDKPFPAGKTKYCLVVKLTDKTNVVDVTDVITEDLSNILHSRQYGIKINKKTTIADIWTQLYSHLIPKHGFDADDEYWDEHRDEPSLLARDALKYFRMVGIDGITDIQGTGTIHENEPTQAVFFNLRCLTHLETVVQERTNPHEIDLLHHDINQIKTKTDLTQFLIKIKDLPIQFSYTLKLNLVKHSVKMSKSPQQVIDLLDALYQVDPLFNWSHVVYDHYIISIALKNKFPTLAETQPPLISNTPLTKKMTSI